MKRPDDVTDWSGIQPDTSAIAHLDKGTFLTRLRLLSERAKSLTILRKAFTEQQQTHGEQFSRYPESTSRSSR